jgi:adenine-specific DNA-methyltransferase
MIKCANYVVDTVTQRQGGIYYTPPLAASAMASWAIRTGTERLLEPCFGSGVFLAAAKQVAASRNLAPMQAFGIELMDTAFKHAVDTGLIDTKQCIRGDFLSVSPFPVDVVIGNPPYIRLRSLPEDQQERALKVTREVLGDPMDTSGSVWMAFVLHAVRFLARGGRLAFVLPYELTHVRYARPLWEFLGRSFGDLRIVRVKERLFPEIMQEVVILFADDHGGATTSVTFEVFDTTSNLAGNSPAIRKVFSIRQAIEDRPFIKALLPDRLTSLLEERFALLTAPVSQFCAFNIGYVSGHKDFFHPTEQTIAKFGLPQKSLRNTLTASRSLSGTGIWTSSISPDNTRRLFYPDGDLSAEERRYIQKGEADKVDSGYKCSRRTPWYKVPDVRVPDLFLSVFKESPTLVSNNNGLVASNSLLCGFLRHPCSADQFISAWYTSLTLLSCELQVHSLGGGVLVLIPGEVGKVSVPPPGSLPTSHIAQLDEALRSTGRDAYRIGDRPVLMGSLQLTAQEVQLIREGASTLASWRTVCRASAK